MRCIANAGRKSSRSPSQLGETDYPLQVVAPKPSTCLALTNRDTRQESITSAKAYPMGKGTSGGLEGTRREMAGALLGHCPLMQSPGSRRKASGTHSVRSGPRHELW